MSLHPAHTLATRPGGSGPSPGWCGLLIALLLSVGTAARAQEPAATPYRGLFPAVAAPSTAAVRATLVDAFDLSVRAFGAVERDTAQAVMTDSGQRNPFTSNYTAVLAEVSRSHTGARYSYELRGSSQFRDQRAAGGLSVDNQWLSVGVRALLTERTALTATQRIAYAPLYAPGVPGTTQAVPGGGAPPPGQGVTPMTNVTIGSAVSVSREFSRRTSAAFAHGFDQITFSSTGVATTTNRTLGTVSRVFRRELTVKLNYASLWSTTTGADAPGGVRANDLGVSFDYSPALSRRTAVTFGITPNVSRRREPMVTPGGTSEVTTHSSFMLGGFAKVEHRFTRAWRADLGYRRMVYYLPGYNQPILADAIGGGADGTLHRWVTASVAAAYSHGTPDIQRSQARVTSMTAAARLEFRPFRATSFYAEYRYDAYAVSEQIQNLPGIGNDARRSSLRVGIAVNVGPSRVAPGRDADR